jgi:hypothetical protein
MNKAQPLILYECNCTGIKVLEPAVLCAHRAAWYQQYECWAVHDDWGQSKYQDLNVLQWQVHAHSRCLSLSLQS